MNNRPVTTLFMLMSVDGKITTGVSDELDVDKNFPCIKGVKEGLHQYYELEQMTDLWSFNTGRVQKKLGVNEKEFPSKSPVSFVLLDNHHLTEHGVRYFCEWSKEFVLITQNPVHPAFSVTADNLHIIKQDSLDLADALKVLEEKIEQGCKSFKVESRRGDKSFRMTSQEMSIDIGGYLLSKTEGKIPVELRNPETKIKCELREHNVVAYSDTVPGYGGLPIGTNGKAMSLLSGGIDSPVASWMVAKRGVEVECIHFHTYPFTSEKSMEKVRDLARILAKYCGKVRLHKVNLLEIQKAVGVNCKEEAMTIISRRFMMRIAEEVGKLRRCDALVTGESIGQVASQTIQGLTCTNASVSMPVFRPLIAMDKTEIIDVAKTIGTFETSIIPEEDCCSVFAPKRPVTKPKLDRIEADEASLDVEGLIADAIEKMEVEIIEF